MEVEMNAGSHGEPGAGEITRQMVATAEKLSCAAEALGRVLARLDAQQDALNAKVDLIVAAVEERAEAGAAEEAEVEEEAVTAEEGGRGAGERAEQVLGLQERVAQLEKNNSDLKAQAERLSRKTLPPMVSALLAKGEWESGEQYQAETVDKTLQALSVEQRIAVKKEMARAGMIA